jgi:hypothetical protein
MVEARGEQLELVLAAMAERLFLVQLQRLVAAAAETGLPAPIVVGKLEDQAAAGLGVILFFVVE